MSEVARSAFIQGFTTDEIADQRNIDRKYVIKLKSQAKKLLEEEMKKHQ